MPTTTTASSEIDLRIFTLHGLDLPDHPNKSGQYVTDCPFCDAEQHFFVTEKGKKAKWKGDGPFFSCKQCSASGNKYTFLKLLYERMYSKTNKHAITRLSMKRKKFNVNAFFNAKIAYNYLNSRWLVPIRNVSGGVTNIHSYDGREGSPLVPSASCSLHLYGLEDLKPSGPILMCEGHWDRMAALWLLKNCQKQSDDWSVLAVPGAGSFPEADIKHLKGREIWWVFDNDEAGHKGMLKSIAEVTPHTAANHMLEWPPNRFTDGFDVTDLVRENKIKPDQCFEELTSWCHQADPNGKPEETIPKLVRNTIEEVIQDFKDTGVHVYPGFRDALILSLSVIESIHFKGEPLWMYLIGVSGAGKSLILESTSFSRDCLYRTAITHRSLLSGFKAADGEGDPSLLAKLPEKSLVVKDYSNVLSLPAYEQDQLFSLLREAYDGRVFRDYGNGVVRQYPLPGSEFEDCRFSFVAGVTPDIYTRDNTALGERFLRFHIPRTGGDDLRAIETAMDDSWRSHQRSRRRAASVAAFLARHGTTAKDELPVPGVPGWYRQRLIALAQFVGFCRSHVSRTKEDLDYEPAVESGTRMAKQLLKLSLAIARITGRKSCDGDVYKLVRNVAWATAHGKRRHIYIMIRKHGEAEAARLAKATGYASSTIYRQLRDMHALGMLKKGDLRTHAAGRSTQIYLLTDKSTEIFDAAKIGEM